MTSLTFQITPEGKLPIGIKETLARMIPTYAGKVMNMTLILAKSKSSDKQRRYYFDVIVSAYQEYFRRQGKSYDKEAMHDALMKNIGGFSKPFVNPFTGEPDDGRYSYNDLTMAQCEGYHTLCRKWLAEHGVDCPEPNEVNYE